MFTIFNVCAFSQVNVWKGTGHRAKAVLTAYPAIQIDSVSAADFYGAERFARDGVAVIICPGGSYYWLDKNAEGKLVAQWLQKSGISGFVLRYRTAGGFAFATGYRYIFRGHRYPDPQDDLRQAIVYLKEHAEEYGISPERIGVMGFSAGGHLVMSSAELFEKEDWPAFIASVYPVVTLSDDCVHRRSRRGLLGDNHKNNKILQDSLSLESRIPIDCPPVFLINCTDDPIVQYHNSELLDSALTIAGVSHKYIQYQTGGHGFGADDSKGTEESRTWKEEFLKWLRELYL